MKWRCMSFQPDMVKAEREGRKTQTRRVMLPQPPEGWGGITPIEAMRHHCKYGTIGDGLIVQEAIHHDLSEDLPAIRYAVDDAPVLRHGLRQRWTWEPHRLAARYMRRELARTFLEIVDVRVQRVNEISEADAMAEGWQAQSIIGPISWYCALWERINAARGYGWNANPWVWAITFKRTEERP